jgi:hypothetical protein
VDNIPGLQHHVHHTFHIFVSFVNCGDVAGNADTGSSYTGSSSFSKWHF